LGLYRIFRRNSSPSKGRSHPEAHNFCKLSGISRELASDPTCLGTSLTIGVTLYQGFLATVAFKFLKASRSLLMPLVDLGCRGPMDGHLPQVDGVTGGSRGTSGIQPVAGEADVEAVVALTTICEGNAKLAFSVYCPRPNVLLGTGLTYDRIVLCQCERYICRS